jgi:SpoVK/Ycf46/Vps4 family AAA+-type ATPase
LVFEGAVKRELLAFVSSSMLLARLGVASNVIDVNRVVLLHGPAGTGKVMDARRSAVNVTAYCGACVDIVMQSVGAKAGHSRIVRAITSHRSQRAQARDVFQSGRLVAHSAACTSLFSKWFSESGKLVAKLFDKV